MEIVRLSPASFVFLVATQLQAAGSTPAPPAGQGTAASSGLSGSPATSTPGHAPAVGKKRRASDCAVIEAIVNESGHVTEAHITRASRDPEFDRRALEQVKQWKNKPAQYQGKAVPVYLSTSVCPHLSY